jgi:tRNA nucleotidyltransferase/poly(A) polymerase
MTIEQQIQAALDALGRPFQTLLRLSTGRQVFLVGGTIRDLLLKRNPADFDFAVSGSGVDFARRFARSIHGSFVLLSETDDQARVVWRKQLILDFNGFADRTIEDDLGRRDFTVNAMAFPLTADSRQPTADSRLLDSLPRSLAPSLPELLDPFHGRQALNDKLLKPVSPESLALDPLRVLRAYRFALELGFRIDDEVREQARRVSLENVAAERIGYEVLRILDCPGSYPVLVELEQFGFLRQLFPEAGPLFASQLLLRHSLLTLKKLDELIHDESWFTQYVPEFTTYFDAHPHRRPLLKLAGLLHDIAKPETEFINDKKEVHFYGHDGLGARHVEKLARERLRLSRLDARTLRMLVEFHMRLHLLATGPELTDRAIRRFFRDLKEQWFGLMLLTYADGFATAGQTRHLEQAFARIIGMKREYDAVIKVKRLVTGDDLIAAGLKPGPAFKSILAELQELQVEGKITSTEHGLEYVKDNMGKFAIAPNREGNGSES